MKKVFAILVLLGLIVGCTTQKKVEVENKVSNIPVEEKKADNQKKIKMVNVSAPSLNGNLLGEKAERKIGIYLPNNYEKETKNYPVVYFLVGYGNTLVDFVNWADLEKIMKTIRTDNKIRDMIFVAIDGQTKAGGSFYTNSPVFGNWEKFIAEDLVSYIDGNYRTIKNKNSRGLTGHSMGGFGTINIGMKYPNVFGYLYSMNPGLYNESGLENSIFYNLNTIEEELKVVGKFNITDEKLLKVRYKSFINGITFASSYGMAFAPTDKMPFYELPYYKNEDKIVADETKMKKWRNGFGNWKEKIIQYKDNFQQLGGFVIDYGTSDSYFWIPDGCRYFEKIMKKEGLDIEMRPNSGDHGDKVQERMSEFMAPYFSEKLIFE